MKTNLTKSIIIASLAIINLGKTGFSQTPNWQWAKSAIGVGTYNDQGKSIAVDASGNVYVTGVFGSNSITFGTTTLTRVSSSDIFIAKYDASGNSIWAKSVGGTGYDLVTGIVVDQGGNIYITGSFSGPSITFGTTTLTNTDFDPSYEYTDIFIAKYDASGNPLWAKSAGGADYDFSNGIAVDASGNAYITGSFRNDSIRFGTTALANSGWDDFFIAKYDASGNPVWAKSMRGTGGEGENGESIAVAASGNVYVTGRFESSYIIADTVFLTNNGSYSTDLFISKYNSSGNLLWIKSAGGTNSDSGEGIALDATGNAYITGFFSADMTIGTTTLINSGHTLDIFTAKYDASGNPLWAKSAGGSSDEKGTGIAVDATGNAYVTGYFGSNTITFGTTTLTNSGAEDIFITKYNASGNSIWAKRAGGTSVDEGGSIVADASENVYTTGYFNSSTAAFGSTTLTNSGAITSSDFFIAKYGYNTTGIAEENKPVNEITVYPNPATTSITITNIPEKASLKLYDVVGNLVYQTNSLSCGEGRGEVNTSQLAQGIYTLVTESNAGRSVNKIVINK